MVKSDGSIDGRLVETDGFRFLVDNAITHIVSSYGSLTVDYLANDYEKGFVVYLG